ncbi:hypothetical protein D3H55_14160 [Bacillus salacetis]|uniref:DUF2007 domain-containing protein n=1 Tax=Bacillus salacetis TaxID=2315464 RepID=A0A3A1QV18_9BACI|nr:hypothetical protein [Bacillus salacetis]RIW32019.1 hypothetical protein D3H55_14160 [Bacillus salacetis]
MLKKLFKKVFAKWEMVYSTQDVGEYSTVKGKLENQGIPYKTKSISSGGGQGGGYGFASTYQLFVPKESVRRASEAIHHSR